MEALGFREYLPRERQSDIITSYCYPADAGFVFEDFYRALAENGFVIYPGKVTRADCFRIGTIGTISPADVDALVSGIAGLQRGTD
jgi:2-aminoethylphosphonate-pyruvate transaminase